MTDLMTTKEVADYLRIKERKVYDLVAEGEIPFTKVTGKYLFPRHLIDLWLARSASFPLINHGNFLPAPQIIVGSHDPLLEWAVRASDCNLALMPGGSLDGLQRFARGEALACAMHVLDLTDGGYNVAAVAQATVGLECVLIEWAWREQGLMVIKGNLGNLNSIADAVARDMRFVLREEQAGSRVLFQHLMSEAALTYDDLVIVDAEARSETEVALAILEGRADTGLGVRAAAHQMGLDFLPLHRERFDLLLRRRDYFEGSLPQLLDFAQSPDFIARAQQLTGYDLRGQGRVHYNPA